MTDEFNAAWMLLCEGKGDVAFFNALLIERGLQNQFCVVRPPDHCQGRNGFGRYLNSVALNESFIQNVKAILIISDKDSESSDSFAEVQAEIRKVIGFNVPDQERVVVKSREKPDLVVLMIPMHTTSGNLESLCLEAAYHKWGLQPSLDEYVAQTPAKNWPVGKQAKMRMQTILASTNYKQPETGFAMHWKTDTCYKIPLDHHSFDEVFTFLQNFGGLLAQR